MASILSIIALCFLSPFLIELQSGNIPLVQFFNPGILLFLMTIGYGLPVLIIREVYIKYRFGLISLLLLGVVYGFYNEGLIARTLIRETGLPIDAFAHGLMIGGLNIGFSLVIVLAHTLQAVIYPILAHSLLFPATNGKSLLSNRLLIVCFMFVLAIGTAAFFRTDTFGTGSGLTYVTILFLMVLCSVLAYLTRDWAPILTAEAPYNNKKNLLLYGASFTMIIILPSLVAYLPVSEIWSLITFVFVCIFLWYKGKKLHVNTDKNILLAGVGHITAGMIISTIFIGLQNAALLMLVLSGYIVVGFATAFFYRKYLR